jgi:hypothetical protein
MKPAAPSPAEPAAILERVRRESGSLFEPGLASLVPPPVPKTEDRIEIWGRRVGRGLGMILAGALLLNLVTHWLF